MAAPLSEAEVKRRIKAFEATKGPAHPSGSITLAAQKLGMKPGALSRYLLSLNIKTDRTPLKTKQECIASLKAFIDRHSKVPSRDEFNAHGSIKTHWKTHWPIWKAFLEEAGVIGDSSKVLLLDIETAPNRAYFWGGTYKQNINPDWIDAAGYVLCWTAKWLGSDEVIFKRLVKGNHKALLQPMHDLLCQAHAVIHYNGQKFDVPTLNKEFLTHGFKPPSPYRQIDCLQTMWKSFLFPSNKLDYIAKVLKIGQKLRHEGPQLWMNCMADDPEAWKKMEAYNRHDVALLEKLYLKLRPWIKGHPNLSSDSLVCPTCTSTNFSRDEEHLAQVLKYARYQCADCGSWFRSNKTLTRKSERYVGIAV